MIVLNKPYGLAVQGGSGVTRHVDPMLETFTDRHGRKPRLVHRLDRDTAGVLVVARTRSAAAFLGEAFKARETLKIYWALVAGVPRPANGRISTFLAKDEDGERMRIAQARGGGADHAVTLYRLADQAGQKVAFLVMRPITGRTHQLRAHAAHIGHPIIGDPKYFNVENWELPGGHAEPAASSRPPHRRPASEGRRARRDGAAAPAHAAELRRARLRRAERRRGGGRAAGSAMKTALDLRAVATLIVLCGSWGLNQVAIKVTLWGIPPALQLGARSTVAALLVFGWCVPDRGKQLFRPDGSLWPGLAVGILFGLEFLAIFLGLQRTTASRAVIFIYLSPFVVALGGHFLLGETLGPRKLVGLGLAFLGLLLAFSDGLLRPSNGTLAGDSLCVLAAVSLGRDDRAHQGVGAERGLGREDAALPARRVRGARARALALIGEHVDPRLALAVLPAFLYQAVWVAAITYVAWFALIRDYPASLLSSFIFLDAALRRRLRRGASERACVDAASWRRSFSSPSASIS